MLWPIFISLLASLAIARAPAPMSHVLVCLGKQEQRFHQRKKLGPFYELNQKLISELLQAHGIDARPDLLTKVCKRNSKSALHLLEALLLEPQTWYVITPHENKMQDSMNRELVKEIGQAAPDLLLGFLASIQATSPTPDCLEKNIPGITRLNQEIKWLQEEVDLEKITAKRKRLTKIFAGIRQVDSFYKACAAQKSKETAKGSGKPSAQ